MASERNASAATSAGEKLGIQQQEVSGVQDEVVELNSEFSPIEEKKIIRRVDTRLVVTCGIMFCFSLMDRNNLGAAAIAGMTKDMQLIQYRYVRITTGRAKL